VSIAEAESRLEPLAIHDNSTGEARLPATIEAASAQAEGLIRAGHSVDLGLMQINSANLHLAGLSVLQSFEACHALAAAARVLAQGYSGGVTVDEQQRALRTALSRYNTGDPLRGFANGYVSQVEAAAQQVVPAIRVPEPTQGSQGDRQPATHDPDGWTTGTNGEWHLSAIASPSSARIDDADGWHRDGAANQSWSAESLVQGLTPLMAVRTLSGETK
jgi:type IV secretion system protein VirB1